MSHIGEHLSHCVPSLASGKPFGGHDGSKCKSFATLGGMSDAEYVGPALPCHGVAESGTTNMLQPEEVSGQHVCEQNQ